MKINSIRWDIEHYKRTERYASYVASIYKDVIDEAVRLGITLPIDPNKPFSFAQFPQAKQRVNELFQDMSSKMTTAIEDSIRSEWMFSGAKNDEWVDFVFKNSKLTKQQLASYYDRNLNALASFQKRKINGLGLSDRVWSYTRKFKNELELSLDIGLGEGKSAQQLSRDVRQYLNDPDKLFRRVRNKYGNLELSKAAKAYHPGQGVYRSSYKNAMRLTRTEANMAYRTADHERWNQLDFVRGIEVRLSNQHVIYDICDILKGRYPKDFVFRGWHPQCYCHAIPILVTDEEYDQIELKKLNGESVSRFKSSQDVTNVPNAFNQWTSENKERADNWKSQPFFIKDNFKGGRIEGGLKFAVKDIKTFIPQNIEEYEKQLGIKVNRDIFSILRKDTPLTNIKDKAGHYNFESNTVNIPWKNYKGNKWKSESIFYHEFGHAADWQNNIKGMKPVKDLMNKYRAIYRKDYNKLYRDIESKIDELGFDYGAKNMLSEMHQASATSDTLKSLNSKFGRGHSELYFKQKGFSEAEFIAHMFENKFIGNPIFKKVMPDLYEDMINLADEIISKLKR